MKKQNESMLMQKQIFRIKSNQLQQPSSIRKGEETYVNSWNARIIVIVKVQVEYIGSKFSLLPYKFSMYSNIIPCQISNGMFTNKSRRESLRTGTKSVLFLLKK